MQSLSSQEDNRNRPASLSPNDEQEKRLRKGHLVNVHAELTQPNGDINIITSRQTLITKHKRTGWGPSLTEHVIPGDPWDIQIDTIFQNREADTAPKTEGHFWLSRNQLLSNVSGKSFSFTGEVKVDKLAPLELTLANGLSVSFTEHSRYLNWERDDTLMFEENVAEFQVPGVRFGTSIFTDSLEHIDDVLRLVSFVGEYRCVCVGWRAMDSKGVTDFHRSRSVPSERAPSVHDALIEYLHFADFLPAAYKAFVEVKTNAALRRALDYVVPDRRDSLESSYIMLYAAVETLVLFFRRQQHLEFIFNDESEWIQLRSDLQKWLKCHPMLSDKKEKRPFVYEKLPELTRYSFSAAFKKFCDHYGVDLSDLWPMVGGGSEDSLSAIRNKLVHGEVYQPKHYRALMGAREHLRWSVYRMIFGMLQWPIDRTKIDAEYVARSPIHKSLEEDRRQISS